jgi:hypothetical protein
MNLDKIWRAVLVLFCGMIFFLPVGSHQPEIRKPTPTVASKPRSGCDRLGWYSADVRLKDHTIFFFDGYYYLASISLPREKAFAYARSKDLCNWEDLGLILDKRPSRKWDEKVIWAPFVWQENGIFYLYYTGVSREFTQSIMLAISTNPADPKSWETKGVVLQPNHQGSLWRINRWADCRDATILKVEDIYYLYYTGSDTDGPILGWATSFSPDGPWSDWGATLTLDSKKTMVESPAIIAHAGLFYLLYNNAPRGEEYRVGPSQIGPWSGALPFRPGWANEIWVGQDGLLYTSYVKKDSIGIDPIHLNAAYNRLLFSVGGNIHRQFFPFLLNPQ